MHRGVSLQVVSAVIALFLAGAAPRSPHSLPVVQHIHHLSTTDYTRVVITLSRPTPYRVFMVPADPQRNLPARLSIDFSPAQLGEVAAALPIHDGLLTRVRTGQFSATTARIVLDLAAIKDYTAFPLSSPYRVVIDVRGTTSAPLVQPQSSALPDRYRIMLDPGHGGHDPGARGVRGLEEKTVVLAISKRLGRKLVERLPVDILFTRTEDVFIPLPERTARANAAKADLFISIHANASRNLQAHGIETYYLNNTNDRATIRLAALENGLQNVQPVQIPDAGLPFILSDLIQSGKEEDSITLAHALQEAVVAEVAQRYPTVRNIGVKKGPFYVLVGAHMPCVLIEVSFLTHRLEGRLLRSTTYQEAIAEGLFQGIARFLQHARQTKGL